MKAIVPKIEIISNPGAIFASEIKSEKVSLVNHQVVSFVIASAIGAEAVETTVSVIGANENGEKDAVSFLIMEIGSTDAPAVQKEATISIGGKKKAKSYVVTVTADMLTGTKCNSVVLKVSAAGEKCDICGTITALYERPRYTE